MKIISDQVPEIAIKPDEEQENKSWMSTWKSTTSVASGYLIYMYILFFAIYMTMKELRPAGCPYSTAEPDRRLDSFFIYYNLSNQLDVVCTALEEYDI